MRCQKCGGRGYIDGWMKFGMGVKATLEQCPVRCNISGYSREVQKRLNAIQQEPEMETPADSTPRGPCLVIPFRGVDSTKL